ncbi:hypothetical protein CU098_001432, partial [Rhizopus stolonifer]
MTALREELRTLLGQVCEHQKLSSPALAMQLKDELSIKKQVFSKLLDNSPKNAEHRKAFIDGKEFRVNEDFMKEATYLSDQLDVDEYEASRLLFGGISVAPTMNSTPLDAAVSLYHDERGYILATLNVILETIKNPDIDQHVHSIFNAFIMEIIESSPSLVINILKSEKHLAKMISALTKNGVLDSHANDSKFNETTLSLRIERLTDERIYLVQILYHIASLFWLAEPDLLGVLEHVQSKNLSDITYPYLLTVVLAALSSRSRECTKHQLTNNESFIKKVHEQITTKQWKVSTSKALVQIQWGLWLSETVKTKPTIEATLKMNKQERITFIESALDLDAFGIMNRYLLYFKQNQTNSDNASMIKNTDVEDSNMEIDGLIVDLNDYTKFVAQVWTDFQPYVVYELESFSSSFILNMSDVFSNFKKVSTEALGEEQPYESATEDKNSLGQFLTLLASIYRDRLNAGLSFWDQSTGLNRFLAWLLDFRSPNTLAATFDFLGAISAGENHIFSWGKLFGTLQHYGREYANRSSEDEPPAMQAMEEDILHKFLYLCQQVVQYSQNARILVWSDPVLRARQKIALDVWNILESSDMVIANKTMVSQPEEPTVMEDTTPSLPQANILFGSSRLPPLQPPPSFSEPTKSKKSAPSYCLPEQPAGFLCEFEDEKSRRLYTETLSLLDLFASLIHTSSKREQLLSGFAPGLSSIPFCLGKHNNRSPGTAPYLSLVIDHIFLNLNHLHYAQPEIQWQLSDACLQIIENSMASFDLQPLYDYLKSREDQSTQTIVSYTKALDEPGLPPVNTVDADKDLMQNTLLAYTTHPGFDILLRILSGGSLVHELFKLVEKGKAAIIESNKNKAGKNKYFRSSMVRCLRIFQYVFSKQDMFANMLVPQLMHYATTMPMGKIKLGNFEFAAPPSTLQSLAKLMLYDTEVIVQTALMVNCEDDLEICRLSMSVLTYLASEPDYSRSILSARLPNHIHIHMGGIGSQLAGILSANRCSSDIILGFSERLEVEGMGTMTYDDYEYDFNVIPFWFAKDVISNIHNYKDPVSSFSSSIYALILDMLLKNTDPNISSPTFTEFLLGYDVKELELKGAQHKSIGSDVPSQLACLTTILHTIQAGTQDDHLADSPVFSHPVLTEKFYQLVYRLSARLSTSTATLHYLRSLDTFYLKQFKLIASRFERSVSVAEPLFEGVLICENGTRVQTDYFTMVSVLNQRAWLLQLIALELHQASHTSSKSAILPLLKLMYGVETDNVVAKMSNINLDHQHDYQQPLWDMLEIINSLEFKWIDSMDSQEDVMEPNYFKDFDPKLYMIKKEEGHELYDIQAIYKLLRQYQTSHPEMKSLASQERVQLELEMGSILKRLMADNRHREIAYGRLHCLRAWKQVVEVTLSDCFDMFTFADRERIVYDLLTMLLSKLEGDLHADVLKGLSEVILSLLTRLREDKRRQSILQLSLEQDVSTLPIEKLCHMFVSIVKAICNTSSTLDVRSTLYSALVNLLQYIAPEENKQVSARLSQAMHTDLRRQLLDAICNDANLGLDTYKAAAYSALEALYVLVDQDHRSIMHDYLVRGNFLKLIIDLSPTSDTVVRDKHDSPVLLLIHEAKISFFMRIAVKREGAQLLLKGGIVNSLINYKFTYL